MPNAAKTVCYWNGQVLHHITEPDINPEGGDPELMRGMSPSNEPFGYRTDIRPGYTIGFSVPVLEGSQEVRWDLAADSNEEGKFTISKGGGAIAHTYWCMVSKCVEKVAKNRTADWTITLLCKQKRPV